MRIKVCGMRDARNIRAVEDIGVDMMGFIFYPVSSRYCASKPSYLPSCTRVGVFVNASLDEIRSKTIEFGLNAVQLHGSESPEFCDSVKAACPGIELIKAIPVACHDDIARTGAYAGHCDMFLFDTKCQGAGGSGVSFDWSLLSAYKGETPFLLSGGLSLENSAEIKGFKHDRLAGYDLNSRFEDSPAMKNTDKLKEFIKEIKR